jgi:hypothetical protein
MNVARNIGAVFDQHLSIAQNFNIAENHADITINLKPLEEHFLMVPLFFSIQPFSGKKAFSKKWPSTPGNVSCV